MGDRRFYYICLFLFLFFNRSVHCVLAYAVDAVHAAGHLHIAFADCNDLSVGGFEAEAVFALLVLIDFEFRAFLLDIAFYGLPERKRSPVRLKL